MTMLSSIMRLATSPQGRRLARQASVKARQLAEDPKNKARIAALREQLGKHGWIDPSPSAGHRTERAVDPPAPARPTDRSDGTDRHPPAAP